jgi:hypothetical protein
MSRALFRGLRSRGIEVRTVLDEGKAGDSDRTQLEYASQIKRVLYSFNVSDFCQLHKEYLTEGRSHAGIVVVYRQRYSAGQQLRLLLKLADTKSAQDMTNTLLFL